VTLEGSIPLEICFRGGGKYAIDDEKGIGISSSDIASTNIKLKKNKLVITKTPKNIKQILDEEPINTIGIIS
jgi:hypothetical protein